MNDEPIRVLHVSDFAAPYPGAFIRQLRMLDEELRARGGGRCGLAFPRRAEDRPWLNELEDAGYDVFLLPEPAPRPAKATVSAIRELADHTGCRVLHSHFGTYDLAVAKAVRQLRRDGMAVAQVWHYRTALEEGVAGRSPVRRLKDYLKYRRWGAGVDLCVGVTEAMAREAAERGMGQRATAVVAGCDTDTFRADDETRARMRGVLGVGDDDVLVLHMGWHWQRKGGDLLAAAARMLAGRGHGNLVFCSIGAPADELEAPVRALPPTDAVHELHQASDIFVSASRSEGFGNGLVEAMACERVTVAALADGQREIFAGQPGCVAVPVDDAAAIADAVEHLLGERARWHELGAANRAHIVEHNSMRRWAREMADVYDRLAEANQPRTDASRAA